MARGKVQQEYCPSCEHNHPVALFREVAGVGKICIFCAEKHEREVEKRQVEKTKHDDRFKLAMAESAALDRIREQREAEDRRKRERRVRKERALKKAQKQEISAEDTSAVAQEELARRELARRHLLPFVERFNDRYEAGWVHKDICARLEKFSLDVAERKSPRLMLCVPPRHGKSEIVSRNFPAWHLGKYPEHEFIACSYASDLAQGFSRKVREILRTPEYAQLFPTTQLNKDSQRIDAWTTTDDGGYVAAGVGGPITGRGAHCVYFGSKCSTPRGIIPISEVKVGDEVLGYDHERKCTVWARVEAISASFKRDLVRLNDAVLTQDHRVWTSERGYVEAADAEGYTALVQPMWDELREADERGSAEYASLWPRHEVLLQQGVRDSASPREDNLRLREQEGVACEAMQGVLSEDCACRPGVCELRNAFQTEDFGAQQECGAPRRGRKRLLQTELLRGVSAEESGAACGQREDLRGVQQGAARQAEEVLLEGVLSHSEGEECRVQRQVVCSEARDTSERRQWVRELWQAEAGDGSSPHRPRRDEQRVVEPGSAVSALPRALSSSVPGVCAMDLEGLLQDSGDPEDVFVVDIQTSTENFFCEGVLVHNCLVIDDPVKNREEADSESVRQSIWDWYTSTAYTRLAPGGGVLIIQTRWHDDDLSGRLLMQMAKEEGDDWEVIEYPAIAVEDERYRRKGEALHPARYPLDALQRIKRAIGDRDWSALYQQKPVADDGDFFTRDMFPRYRMAEQPAYDDMSYYTAWDLAIGQSEQNDETFGITVGVDRNKRIWVVDVRHGRWDSEGIVNQILDTYAVWRSDITGIERGHIEMAIGPYLEQEIQRKGLKTMYIQPLKPGRRDKQSRARSIQALMKRNEVMFRSGCEATQYLIDQMLRFPSGVHDDGVDAMAWVGQMIGEMTSVSMPKPKKRNGWRQRLMQSALGRRGSSSHMGA